MADPVDSSRPLEEQMPPPNLGSLAEADWLHEPGLPFWKPTWVDSLKYLGWRWILVLPIFLPVIFVACIPFSAWLGAWVWLINFKVLIMVIGLPLSSLAYAMKNAVKARKEPFCIHCGYGLTGLPDNHRCPECGRPYTFALIAEYQRDPDWFIQRCKAQKKHPATQAFAAGPFRSKRKSRDGT